MHPDKELKPCPFCGGAAEMDTQQFYRNIATGRSETAVAIYCTSCPAQVMICRGDVPDVEPKAVTELWNTRPAPLEALSGGEAVAYLSPECIEALGRGDVATVFPHAKGASRLPLYAAPRPMPGREALIDVIMRETTDEITENGHTISRPNVLVQGCQFIRGHQRGYERPQEAAQGFAGLIADAILSLFSASLGGREDSPSLSQPSADAQERSPGSLHSDGGGIQVGKPLPYFCDACQAFPREGYCKLAGCPTAPQHSDGGRG